MRAVVDTTVWVPVPVRTGLPHRLLLRWRDGEFEAVVSPMLLNELSRVLHTIALRIGASPDLADAWADLVAQGAQWVIPTEAVAVCRDVEDNAVLEAALAGHADCIVSGDQDLLSLGEFRGVSIVTPRQFADWLDLRSAC